MNKAAVPFAVTVIVVVAMLGVWMISGDSTEDGYFSSNQSARSEQIPTVPGKIITINEDQFQDEVLGATQPVLVDFYADWCGPCKVQGRVLKDYLKRGTAAKIVKIDIDRNPGLATKFEVEAIPTLLVFKGGELKQRHTGLAQPGLLDKLLE